MSEQYDTPKRESNGGLWEERDKNKDVYFSGNIEVDGKKIRFRAFPNRYKKEGEKTPDFRIFISDNAVNAKQSIVSKILRKEDKIPAPVAVKIDQSPDDEEDQSL